MKNFNLNVKKNVLEKRINNLKTNKVDYNDIVLVASAMQDQMLIEMGLKKKKIKKKKIFNYKIEEKNTQLKNILYEIKEDESDLNIINQQQKFLNGLTFAEKIGLKKINKMPLNIKQWRNLEDQTINRNVHKGACPICLENLYKKDSLILSCSHVFHKICIQNFEKFSLSRKCPICRCDNYQTKEYLKDKEYYIKEAITLIQKYFLGFITRLKLYKNIFSINMPNNKHLRSIYSHWKIKELTNKMCSTINKKVNETKKLISEFENDFSDLNQLKKEVASKLTLNDNINWNEIIQKAMIRKSDSCAICLSKLYQKKVYILDCTHSFHINCLNSFEQFDIYYERRCPICRSNYKKKELIL